MLNKNLYISLSKRTFLFSLLVILMLLAFSEQNVKLQTNNLSKPKVEELSKAFYQVPAQKLHSFTIVEEQTLLVATNLGLLAYDGKSWQKMLSEETFSIKATNNGCLIAGTRLGINISNDNGKSWYLSNQGLVDGLVPLSIELADQDTRIYIGTDRHGIFRSNDGGANWTAINNGLPPAIGIHPFEVIKRLSISPNNSDLVFASTEASGVYWSKDAGDTWQKATLNLPGDFIHRVNPPFVSFEPDSNTVYALVNFPINSHRLEHSIHKSIDGGSSWELVGKLPPNQTFFDFSVANNIASIKATKGLQKIGLAGLADEERRKFLSTSSIPSNLLIIPGTDPDFEKDDIGRKSLKKFF